MYIFGVNIPILELLVVFCITVVIYLIILELQFRELKRILVELRKLVKKFAQEEEELEKTGDELEEIMKNKKAEGV